MKEIKVVIDTNVFISTIIARSKTMASLYIGFIKGQFTPIMSLSMYEELLDVLSRKKLRRYFGISQIEYFKKLIDEDTIFVIPTQKVTVCRDIKDNIILEAALAAEEINFIVSGDDDLLELKTFHNISILTPWKFLRRLKK